MAKKKDNTTAFLLLGVAAFLLLNRRPRQQFVPYQSYVPQQPPRSAASAWANWANQIVNIYGNVRELWQPGGPFENVPQNQVIDALNTDQGPFGFDPTVMV